MRTNDLIKNWLKARGFRFIKGQWRKQIEGADLDFVERDANTRGGRVYGMRASTVIFKLCLLGDVEALDFARSNMKFIRFFDGASGVLPLLEEKPDYPIGDYYCFSAIVKHFKGTQRIIQ